MILGPVIAQAIVADCKDPGYDSELTVPEEYDVCLSARCYRANSWCERLGKRKCFPDLHPRKRCRENRKSILVEFVRETSKNLTNIFNFSDSLTISAIENKTYHFTCLGHNRYPKVYRL